MAIRVNTAGMKLLYAVEASAGTMPTAMSAYTMVPEITGTPDLFVAPNTEDVTPIDETEMVQYLDLLKDFGGTLDFPCNWCDALDTAWNTTLIGAYNTGKASSKDTWFCVYHPKLTNAVYFRGKPIKSGMNEISANTALKGTCRIVPEGGWTFAAKPSTS